MSYYQSYAPYGQANYMPRNDMQPQPMTQPQQAAQSFFCRPVASREEVLGVPVDFMGTPMFFPDLAHGVIYLKRFNANTGSPDLFEFRVTQPQPTQQEQRQEQSPTFVPLQDFLDLKNDLDDVKTELEKLKKPAGRTAKKEETTNE